jgi:hypothetical protein
LLTIHYPDTEKVILISGNLNEYAYDLIPLRSISAGECIQLGKKAREASHAETRQVG